MITSNEHIQATARNEIRLALEAFADAQTRGDVAALDQLLTDDFKLVGPRGLVLPKRRWLEQFDTPTVRIESLDWDELDIRTYGYRMVAIAIGRLTQTATDAQALTGGQYRVTAIALRDGPQCHLTGAQYTRIATPGAESGGEDNRE